jgi:hypothetical protein
MANNLSVNRRRLINVVGVVIAVAGAAWWSWSLTPPPQIGADEEVFQTVDALFTALTSRDEKRLGECEQRLHASCDAGRLPAEPARYLDGVIQEARTGDWERAARRLYDFMYGQRKG